MLPRWLDTAYLRDVIRASDPDGSQLLLATRASLTVGAAALALFPAVQALGQPEPVAFVGVLTGMMAQVSVQDVERRQQALTLLLLPLPAAISLLLAGVFGPSTWPGTAAFMAVTFAGIWARRFGPRGAALGTIGFLSYFFAIFAHATRASLPWMLASVLVGLAIAALIRLVLLPDRPVSRARRGLVSLRHGAAATLRHLADRAGSPDFPGRRLRRQLNRQGEDALALVDLLDCIEPAAVAPGLSRRDIEEHALELELALGVVFSATRFLGSEQVEPARRALGAAATRLRSSDASAALPRTGGELDAALDDLLEAARPPQAGDAWRPPGEEVEVVVPQPPSLDPDTRHAIQASLAAGLAIVAGRLLSPDRYYWAAIAAFVVFLRASHQSEMLQRAWFRIAGTVLGVVLGIAMGSLVRGSPRLDLVLLLVAVFLAFRLINTAYAAFVFFFTLALALLYAQMGTFTSEILWVRLGETLIGAAAGALISLLVLPERSAPRIRQAVADTLGLVADSLEGGGDGPAPAADLRALHRAVVRLRSVAGPVIGTFERLTPRLARRVNATTALGFYARLLAGTGLSGLDAAERERARERLVQLAALARQAAEAVRRAEALPARPPVRPAPGPRPRAVREIERIDVLLATISR